MGIKILIVNPFGIGDVIFSTPLIEALKRSYPESSIGYICNKRAYEVIKSNPRLDMVFIYEKDDYRACWQRSRFECIRRIYGLLGEIRAKHFDVAIDLSLGYQYSLALKLIGIKERLGFNYRKRGRFLTRKITIDGFCDKHVVEYYLDMLTLLNVDPLPHRMQPKVYLQESDAAWAADFLAANGVERGVSLVGVIPGCGASWGADACRRRWGRENFARVCDGIADRHHARIILLGDRNESTISAEIERSVKHPLINACGKTTIGNFLGLLQRCSVIITNDGGPLHMAVSVGARTVSIFGPVDERIYGPYPSSPDHIVISRKELPCRPCYKKFKHHPCEKRSCLEEITADEVMDAAGRILSGGVRAP